MFFCDHLPRAFLTGFIWFITFMLSPLVFRWLPRCQCNVTQRDIYKINRYLITTKRKNDQNNRSKAYHYNDVIMSTIASQITSFAIVYSTVYSGADQRKHQSSASLAFVRGIHREFPAQRTSIAEKFSFWWRHHVFVQYSMSLCLLGSPHQRVSNAKSLYFSRRYRNVWPWKQISCSTTSQIRISYPTGSNFR